MKPIATSYPQAAHYFEQGVRCVRCVCDEVVKDCYSPEDAYDFFDDYDSSGAAVWITVFIIIVVIVLGVLASKIFR